MLLVVDFWSIWVNLTSTQFHIVNTITETNVDIIITAVNIAIFVWKNEVNICEIQSNINNIQIDKLFPISLDILYADNHQIILANVTQSVNILQK